MQHHEDKHRHEHMFPMGDDKEALIQCKNEFLFIILFLASRRALFLLRFKIFSATLVLETYKGDVSKKLKCTLSVYSLRLLNILCLILSYSEKSL